MLGANATPACYRKRVSFSNLYDEVIDPTNPRYQPVFITQNEDGNIQNDGSNNSKKQEIDMNFGYDVVRSSNYLSSTTDPSRFFKFNDFNMVNERDRTARQLKSQFDFNEKLSKKQKLKNEKLPKISEDKSILRKSNLGQPNNLSIDLNSLAYPHPNSKFQKTADHDDLTFKNTQININLNPDIKFVKNSNIIAEKIPQNKKKLSEMTDEEILALDSQFTRHSMKANDMLADLETSIESSKFKSAVNIRKNSFSGNSSSTNYTKDGINLTNFFAATYPTRPSINYNSIVLQNQHERFDWTREINTGYRYPSRDIIEELESITNSKDQELFTKYLDGSGFERFQESRKDEDKAINKTIMIYINGTHHGMNPLNFTIHSSQLELLKDGDELVIFAIIPHELELLKHLLNVNLDQNSADGKRAPLVRYKTSSMLDDLEKFNNKNNNSITNNSRKNSDLNSNGSKGRSSSLVMSPTSPISVFPKQRLYSTIEPEIKRTKTSSSTNTSTQNTKKDSNEAMYAQKQKYYKVINEKILEIGKKLMKKIIEIVGEKQLILKITLEICLDKIIHNLHDEKSFKSNREEYNPDAAFSDNEENSVDYDNESLNENAIYDTDDDLSFDHTDSSDDEDKDSTYPSRNLTENINELFFSNKYLSRISTSDSKRRRASSAKTIRLWKKLKQRKKLNIKFVIDNIVRVYNPELLIIGTKNQKDSFFELLKEKISQDEASNKKNVHLPNSELSRILSNNTDRVSATVCDKNIKNYLNIAEFLVSKTNLHILIIPECSNKATEYPIFSNMDNEKHFIDPFMQSLKQSTDNSRKKCLKFLNNPELMAQLRTEEEKDSEKKKALVKGSVNSQIRPSLNCNSYFKNIYDSDSISDISDSDDNIPLECSTKDKPTTPVIPTIKFSDVNFDGVSNEEKSALSISKIGENLFPSKSSILNNDNGSKNSHVRLQKKSKGNSETNKMIEGLALSSDDRSFINANNGVLTNTPPTSTESSLSCINRERPIKDENVSELIFDANKNVEKSKKKKGFFKKMMGFGK